MTMLLSAWQDALRRNMAYKQGREEKADRKRSLMETAGDKIGELASKMFSTNDAMEKLREQHQMTMAREAAQREWEAGQNELSRKQAKDLAALTHGYRVEESGEKPHPQWETPEERAAREMQVQQEITRRILEAKGLDVKGRTSAAGINAGARVRAAGINAARPAAGPRGAGQLTAEEELVRKIHKGHRDAAISFSKMASAPAFTQDSRMAAGQAAERAKTEEGKAAALEQRYPWLVGAADVRLRSAQPAVPQQPSQPLQPAPQVNPFSGLLE